MFYVHLGCPFFDGSDGLVSLTASMYSQLFARTGIDRNKTLSILKISIETRRWDLRHIYQVKWRRVHYFQVPSRCFMSQNWLIDVTGCSRKSEPGSN